MVRAASTSDGDILENVMFGQCDIVDSNSGRKWRRASWELIGELAPLCTAYRVQNADDDLIHKWLVVFAPAQHGHPVRILP
jgi:hypothetical protein